MTSSTASMDRVGAAGSPEKSTAAGRARRRRPGAFTVFRCELDKLEAQLLVRAVLAACFVVPFGAALVLRISGSLPVDTLFGRWVQASGFAAPLVMLVFLTQWALPLLVSLVAGDMFAAEDRHGTWPTILTRSCSRGAIFWGKACAAATYSVAVVAVLAAGSLLAGQLVMGRDPLVSLSGTLVPPLQAAGLVLAAWATVLPPVLAFTAMGVLFSVATRSTPAGILGPTVVGLVMQLFSLVNGADTLRHLLLTTPFTAWHGLFEEQRYYGPLLEGSIVSAIYLVGCLAGAHIVLRRRDIAGR